MKLSPKDREAIMPRLREIDADLVTSDKALLKIAWDPYLSGAAVDRGDGYVHDRARCRKTLTRGQR
jgi:hypothetical protein